jgi:hypothetical protein
MNLELPKLDLKQLQEKAQEAAMKGATKEIEEFYSGFNSPFRKAVQKHLESKTTSIHLELPDIIARINEALSEEVDRIANNSIAETFLPLATEALTRIDKHVKFSEILNEFVKSCHNDFKDEWTRPDLSVNEDEKYHWLNIKISYTDYKEVTQNYTFTLHKNHDELGYRLLSLPFTLNASSLNYTKKMKLKNGEGSIEMPFTRGSLKDEFTAYMARLVICESEIEMDCDFFDEDMFRSEY